MMMFLLFADDMAIAGKSPIELKNNLDILYLYCYTWGHKI
jgi:hypothetical protein